MVQLITYDISFVGGKPENGLPWDDISSQVSEPHGHGVGLWVLVILEDVRSEFCVLPEGFDLVLDDNF